MTTINTPPDRHHPTDRSAQVERLIHRALQDLPPQHAPRALQARVLAIVERRNQAWWRRSFAGWPLPARIAFGLFCATLAKLSVDGSMWLLHSTRGLWQFESSTFAAWHALAAVHAALTASIPTLWWYGVLTLIAGASGGVFAIGTIAYRTLYAVRQPSGHP